MTRSKRQITTGAGLSVGAVLAAPSAAQADDLTVTNLNDSGAGSLREAIEDASADADADRILFKSKLSGAIDLSDANASISIFYGDLEILGPGARRVTVNAAGSQIFRMYGAPTFALPPIDVAISGLTLTGGSSPDYGGAIAAFGDVDLTVARSTLSGNEAGDAGGAIAAGLGAPLGSLVFEDSTVSRNGAGVYGGGIFTTGIETTVVNSTISGNSAGQDGGGIYISNDGGSLEVRNSTIADNRAAGSNGGGIYAYEPTELRGALVADNTADDDGDDVWGSPFESAFSLIEDPGNTGVTSSGGNLIGVDPKLKPLKDNGGPTDTQAFKKSPAKNKGPSDAPDKDQRGAPRKGQPDIGAYEFSKCKGVIVNRVGTSGKDKLKGTKKKDGMLGLGGNDKLKGKKGKDGLCGGRGKDKLIGGPGKDKFNGGPGKDKEIQ